MTENSPVGDKQFTTPESTSPKATTKTTKNQRYSGPIRGPKLFHVVNFDNYNSIKRVEEEKQIEEAVDSTVVAEGVVDLGLIFFWVHPLGSLRLRR